MAQLKKGTIVSWENLSPILAIFRLMPEEGSRFPSYQAGQYMALRREDCRLTKRIIGQDGRPHFVPDLDESGQQKRGPVTHSYSISSAPFETEERGHLEFYVVLEEGEEGPGRLTESLFRVHPDDPLPYVDRIVGDFTLARRSAGFRSVVWVGTGTGLAPFASMVKELHFEARRGTHSSVRYTLFHTNRTVEELAYHDEILAVEASGLVDFVYVPSVSRPTQRDRDDPSLGTGRANNVLRHVLGMPMKEEQDFQDALSRGENPSEAALAKAVRPTLPRHLSAEALQKRLVPAETVILSCGNPSLMADIKTVADAQHIRFEKEDW
jgi:ferredoxin-NADP reductase